METTIDESGRMAIPKELQNELGLAPGMTLSVEAVNGTMVVKPSGKKSGLVRENGAWVFYGELECEPSELIDIVKKDREDRMRHVTGMS